MVESKGCSWADVKNPICLESCEESYFYVHKWMKVFTGNKLDENTVLKEEPPAEMNRHK